MRRFSAIEYLRRLASPGDSGAAGKTVIRDEALTGCRSPTPGSAPIRAGARRLLPDAYLAEAGVNPENRVLCPAFLYVPLRDLRGRPAASSFQRQSWSPLELPGTACYFVTLQIPRNALESAGAVGFLTGSRRCVPPLPMRSIVFFSLPWILPGNPLISPCAWNWQAASAEATAAPLARKPRRSEADRFCRTQLQVRGATPRGRYRYVRLSHCLAIGDLHISRK